MTRQVMTTLHLHACTHEPGGEPGCDIDWALSRRRQSDTEEWATGRRLLVVAASDPPTLACEAEVTATVEARYSSKTDAWRRLQSLDGASVAVAGSLLVRRSHAGRTRSGLAARVDVCRGPPTQAGPAHRGWHGSRVGHGRLRAAAPTRTGRVAARAKTTTARSAPSRPLWIRTWPHSSVLGRSRSRRRWLHALGYLPVEVRDARPEEPFDLLAETDTRRLPVVVRGLVGDLRPVTVTGPEIQASFEEPTAMLVVHGIVLLRDAAGLWSATDGRAYQIRPWRPQKPALLPASFRFDPVGTGRFAWYRDVWHPGDGSRTPQRARPPTHVPSRTCAPTVSIQGRRPVGPPGRFQTGRATTAAPNGAVPTER